MRTEDLEYDLDDRLIATEPVSPRDHARLLVCEIASDGCADRIEHCQVRDLPRFLRPGDALVLNETTVLPARVKARRASGGLVEGLLLERIGPRAWWALLKNAKKTTPGERLSLIAPDGGEAADATLRIEGRGDERYRVSLEGTDAPEAILERAGWTPLPPYILRSRRAANDPATGALDRLDRARYQTIYARPTERPSVAAPTAGLHFTPELLGTIDGMGIERIAVELQVGAGTFKPIESASLEAHPMHRERCVVQAEARRALRDAFERSARGEGRVIAVGTTSVRTLESMPEGPARPEAPDDGAPLTWETDLLIQPGYRFRRVDGLLTNFHLPRSTLLALVAAFAGLDRVKALYAEAIRERYRFYSFGDAMLLVRRGAALTSAS